MNFQFEFDFEGEEITISVDHNTVAVVYRDEDAKLCTRRIKPEFEDFEDELLRICKAMLVVAENC